MSALGVPGPDGMGHRAREVFYVGEVPKPCVSMPVLGELMVQLQELPGERGDEAFSLLQRHYIAGHLSFYGFGAPDRSFLRALTSVHDQDDRVGPTDAAVIACFLSDPEASVIYTSDALILESAGLSALAGRSGKRIKEYCPS